MNERDIVNKDAYPSDEMLDDEGLLSRKFEDWDNLMLPEDSRPLTIPRVVYDNEKQPEKIHIPAE